MKQDIFYINKFHSIYTMKLHLDNIMFYSDKFEF
jgi:hypothetical protein